MSPYRNMVFSITFTLPLKAKTVILEGQASRPTLKSSAENVTKKVEGVEHVDNQIEVLPNSPNDDRIRAAVYYRIYGQPQLQKYTSNRGPQFLSLTRRTMGITYDPPIGYHAIHIIVKNGNVTLIGAVDNSSDAAIAGIQANSTPGVFSVDNNLFVTSDEKEPKVAGSLFQKAQLFQLRLRQRNVELSLAKCFFHLAVDQCHAIRWIDKRECFA